MSKDNIHIRKTMRKTGLRPWLAGILALLLVFPTVVFAQDERNVTKSFGTENGSPFERYFSASDTVAFNRLKELRSKAYRDMTPAEFEEYSQLKGSERLIELDVAEMLRNSANRANVYSPLCSGAIPVCTQRGAYEYDATTNDNGAVEFGNNGRNVSCLRTTPSPAWFYFKIDEPGNMLLYLSMAHDIDFICYGPFSAPDGATLLEQNCVGTLENHDNDDHRPRNGDHVSFGMGGYPAGNVVDCSYDPAPTEWCYIPNAQVGDWYIIMITNYSRQSGEVFFDAINSGQTITTAKTNCNIVANVHSNSPLCSGSTLTITANVVNGADRYDWFYTGNTADTAVGHGTLLASGAGLSTHSISNVTTANSGYYALDLYSATTGRYTRFMHYVKVIDKPTGVTITASATEICQGSSVNLTANATGTVNRYTWSNGATTASQTVFPNVTTTYIIAASNYYSGTNPNDGSTMEISCSATAEQLVTVLAAPALTISPAHATVCSGSPLELTATSSCNTCTVEWYVGASGSGTGSKTVTVTPTASTTYSARVSSGVPSCPYITDSVLVNVAASMTSDCNFIYVSPTGTGTGNTPSSPTSLATALDMSVCSGGTIKMTQGTYNLDAPLVMASNLTLEGGYSADFSTKSSVAGATTIHRTANNVEGLGTSSPRLVAIEGSGLSNINFRDITVTTADAPLQTTTVLLPYNKSRQVPVSAVNMPASGTAMAFVTTGAKVYDDGGPSSNYSSDEESSLILYPVNGGKIRVYGSVVVEGNDSECYLDDCYDNIKIYSYENGTETQLNTHITGSYSSSDEETTFAVDLTSTSASGALKIFFDRDQNTTAAGIDFTVEEVGTGTPPELTSANVPVSGSATYIVTDGFKVYDDGGPSSNYSNKADGYVILRPANSGKISVSGSFTVEGNYNDYPTIISCSNDGTEYGSALQDGQLSGSGEQSKTISNLTSTSPDGALKIRFRSDNGTNYAGLDFTITEVGRVQPTTTDTAEGVSTYALHLSNCTNYELTRCQLKPGNASSGGSGVDGTNGANGANGNNGTAGTKANGENAGGPGGSGTSSMAGSQGGGAGGAGGNGEFVKSSSNEKTYYGFVGYAGSNAAIYSGSYGIGGTRGQSLDSQVAGSSMQCTDCNGQNGHSGGNGSNGVAGTNGTDGVLTYGAYLIQQNGTDGTDGYGGGGGGGGQGGCNAYNSRPAVGGGGGGGGQGGGGGTAGTKGYAGGSSVAIYLHNTAFSASSIVDCYLSAGTAGTRGAGGVAGLGGTGGTGGTGGNGYTNSSAIGGKGGNGGNGGKGGNGGRGGNGSAGVSYPIAVVSGTSLTSTPSYTNKNLAGQATITVGSTANPAANCSKTEMGYSSNITDFGSGAVTSGGKVKYTTTGTKTLKVGSDTYTDFINISNLLPDVTGFTIIGLDTVCCPDHYTYSIAGLGTDLTVEWSFETGSSSLASIFLASDTSVEIAVAQNTTGADATATLKATISSTCCGLAGSITKQFKIRPILQSIDNLATGEVKICTDGSHTFQVKQGGAPIDESKYCEIGYLWKLNGTPIPGAINSSYTATAAGTYSVELSAGCGTISKSAVVSVYTAPQVTISNINTVCAGADATFRLSTTSTENVSVGYSIDGVIMSPVTVPAGGYVDVPYVISANAILRLLSATVSDCSSTLNKQEILAVYNDPGDVYAGEDRSVCVDTINMRAISGVGAWVGQWSIVDGAENVTISNLLSPSSRIFYSGTTYPHTATCVWTLYNTTCGNLAKDTVYITFNGPLTVNVVSDATNNTICNGDAVNLTVMPSRTTNVKYTWDVPGSAHTAVVTATPDTTITYNVVVKDTVVGCEAYGDKRIEVLKPEVTLNSIADQSFCVGGSATLSATLSGTHTGNITYAWTPSTGLSSTTDATVVATPSSTTTYTAQATATITENGVTCSKSDAETVTVTVLPNTVNLTISKTDESCAGHDGKMTATVTGGTAPISYLWSNGATTNQITGLTCTDASAGKYSVVVTDANSCTKKDSATIVFDAPSPKAMTIEAKSQTWSYDGTTHSNNGYTVTISGTETHTGTSGVDVTLNNGYKLNVVITGSQKEVGTSANTVTSYTIMDGATSKACEYAITRTPGLLTVNKRSDITLTMPTNTTKKYDGQPIDSAAKATGHGTDIIKVEYSTDSGRTWSITPPSLTNADTLLVQVRATNPNYDTVTNNYKLSVTRRLITMTSGSSDKPYDGTPLTNHTVTVTGDGFISGEGVTSYNYTGSQTTKGSSDNTFTYTLNGSTLASNYAITPAPGTLTVTASDSIKLTVPASMTKEYDGTPLNPSASAKGLGTDTIKVEYSIDGGSTWVTIAPSLTNVDTVPVLVRATNPNYSTKDSSYKLSITPRAITVTARDTSFYMDGSAHDASEMSTPRYTIDSTRLVSGHKLITDVTSASISTLGSTPTIVGTVTIKDASDNDVTSNYKVTKVNGTLSIQGYVGNIIITSHSKELECNGTPQKEEKYTVTYDGTELTPVPGSDGKKFVMPTLGHDTLTITPTFAGITNPSENAPNNNIFNYVLQNPTQYVGTKTTNYGTIKMYDSLSVVVTPTPVTCNGKNDGKATVVISGGKKDAGNYSYKLNGGTATNTTGTVNLTALTNGSHTFYVKDSLNYDKTVTITITQPNVMTLTLTADDPVCSNGTVMSHVTGGNGGNTFKLNASSTTTTHGVYNDLSAGKQVVTATDSKGCVAKDSVTLVHQSYTAIEGITRYGEIAEYSSDTMMRDQYGQRYQFPTQSQYGENLPQPELSTLSASVVSMNQIQVSVNVVASSTTPVLEFQVSVDENFAATSPVYSYKVVNVGTGTKNHTFANMPSGTYYVRVKLYNCSGGIKLSHSGTLSIP